MKRIIMIVVLVSAAFSACAQVGFSVGVSSPAYYYPPFSPAYGPTFGFGVNVAPAYQPSYVYVNQNLRDRSGKKYWRIINRLNRPVRVTATRGGERAVIAPGESMRITRGASFSFQVDARNRRSKMFTTNRHYVVLFTNRFGEIDYER